jgi:hypothetical protein
LDLDLCFVCRGAIPAPQRKNQIMAGSFIVPSINVDSCIIEEQDDHLVLQGAQGDDRFKHGTVGSIGRMLWGGLEHKNGSAIEVEPTVLYRLVFPTNAPLVCWYYCWSRQNNNRPKRGSDSSQ